MATDTREWVRLPPARARGHDVGPGAPASTSVAELFAAGTVPMLEKPFTQAALATSVRRAIDGTAAPPA